MRDVLMRANKLLNTERHIHVPFLAHLWVGIRCCVVLCAERNIRGVDGFFIDKGGGGGCLNPNGGVACGTAAGVVFIENFEPLLERFRPTMVDG